MEASPITLAHQHARAAAVATRQPADTTVAINEHTQAAGEFANAARSTSSVEALRTLKLLEEHHRRLADILSLPPDPQPDPDASADEKSPETSNAAEQSDTKEHGDASAEKPSKTSKVERVRQQQHHGQRRIASREMSSSIASNLASARGIKSKGRGQPLLPSVSNDQAPGNLDPHPRRDGSRTKMQHLIDHNLGKPAWVPPAPASPTQSRSDSQDEQNSPLRSPSASATVDDGGYTRFYSTFGSLINKISAPLAFAGLPLIQEESVTSEQVESPQPSPSKRKPRAPASVSVDPDLSKIYSKATMRAMVRDGHGTHESFYVVPTSGHTMSYASILSYAEKEKRRNEGHSLGGEEEDDEDFVDARERLAPLSPGAKRRIGRARTEKELSNTIEELYTENKSLKDMLDKLSKRLHVFEASAQNLAESYRAMRPSSPMSPASSRIAATLQRGAAEDSAATDKIRALEKENRKMTERLERYRLKWEDLRAGAKARREAQGGGNSVTE